MNGEKAARRPRAISYIGRLSDPVGVDVDRDHDSTPGGLVCPNCGEESEFRERVRVSVEPHGEQFEDYWLQCVRCGKPCEDSELIGANEEVEFERRAA